MYALSICYFRDDLTYFGSGVICLEEFMEGESFQFDLFLMKHFSCVHRLYGCTVELPMQLPQW